MTAEYEGGDMGRKASIGAAVIGAALTLAGPSRAGCPAGDLPPGVRPPDRPGCQTSGRRPVASDTGVKQQRDPGVFAVGHSTEVRISGRVRAETRVGR